MSGHHVFHFTIPNPLRRGLHLVREYFRPLPTRHSGIPAHIRDQTFQNTVCDRNRTEGVRFFTVSINGTAEHQLTHVGKLTAGSDNNDYQTATTFPNCSSESTWSVGKFITCSHNDSATGQLPRSYFSRASSPDDGSTGSTNHSPT